jgi:NADH:ubiquinone oxidoreductase subunit E
MAPNIIVDDEVIGKATKETVIEKIRLALAAGAK